MGNTELGESGYWILTILAGGRRHGYAIIAETAAASGGRVALKATTLYAAAERLERAGLVAVDGEEVVDGRARRYFRLTDAGARRLADETAALEARAAAARARLAARVASAAAPARGAAAPTATAFAGGVA